AGDRIPGRDDAAGVPILGVELRLGVPRGRTRRRVDGARRRIDRVGDHITGPVLIGVRSRELHEIGGRAAAQARGADGGGGRRLGGGENVDDDALQVIGQGGRAGGGVVVARAAG